MRKLFATIIALAVGDASIKSVGKTLSGHQWFICVELPLVDQINIPRYLFQYLRTHFTSLFWYINNLYVYLFATILAFVNDAASVEPVERTGISRTRTHGE